MRGTVVLSAPAWHLSGVNTMNAHLARALATEGFEVEVLLTGEDAAACARLREEHDLPFRSLGMAPGASFPRRWRTLIAHLSGRAPCVYFPGYDFDHASVCPALPHPVAAIGVLHSDESPYYGMTERVGSSWNRLVGVSSFLAGHARARFPTLAARCAHVPYGVEIPTTLPARTPGTRLEVALVGRISQYQKRVLDLIPLTRELERLGAPVRITLFGGGPEEAVLRERLAGDVAAGRIHFAGNLANTLVLDALHSHDVLLMLSEFEGLPLVLLEAMGRGCIPVVTDIRSGVPDVVENGVNGWRAPVGAVGELAGRLAELAADPATRAAMSRAAFHRVDSGGFRIADMTNAYIHHIDAALQEARAARSPGRTGRIVPPRHLRALGRWRMATSGLIRRVLGLQKPARR